MLLLASQRLIAGSVWATLPLDVVRHIFSYLAQPGKRASQLAGAAAYVFSNFGEMWASLRAEKRGIILWERVRGDQSSFRWVACSAPVARNVEAKPAEEVEEKCCVQ